MILIWLEKAPFISGKVAVAGLGTLGTLRGFDQFSKLFSSPSPQKANREINTSSLSSIGAIDTVFYGVFQSDTFP